MAKRKEGTEDVDHTKRRGNPLPHDHLERFLLDLPVVRPTPSYAFLENSYLRGLYELLHTNCLYMWLRGDFGPFDEPTILRSVLDDIWFDLPENGFFCAAYIRGYYVTKELEFWSTAFPKSVKIFGIIRPRDFPVRKIPSWGTG